MRIVRVTAVIIVLLSLGLVLLLAKARPTLSYRGQSIDYWFTQLPLTVVSSQGVARLSNMSMIYGPTYGSTNTECLLALESFGTNAIPYLLMKLADKDSVFERRATQAAWKMGLKSFPARNADFERYQAVTGLLYCNEFSAGSLQALTNLSKAAKLEIAEAAKFILREHGRPGLPWPHSAD